MRTVVAWTKRILAVGFMAFVVLVLIWFAITRPALMPPATVDFDRLDESARKALFERGRYIARAADCAACHNTPDGVALAGGTPLETPIGTIYGSNITPSIVHGIGDWSADDLYRSMVEGIAKGGTRLYPAMPYASYHQIERADVDALWFWLMRQRPVDIPSRAPELPFPFDFRPAIAFWNRLFLPHERSLPTVAGRSSDWHRGRYLVDVLGHCGECHTPRNLAYAKSERHLRGGVIEQVTAPDISAEGLRARGWTGPDLHAFLRTGLASQGTMTFNMYPVLEHSTQYLVKDDLVAISAYLFDDRVPVPSASDLALAKRAARSARRELPPAVPPGDRPSQGRTLYLGLCAGCHGTDGEGKPHASVPLTTNTTAMLEDPRNLVRILLQGVPARELAHGERMQAMPAYAGRLSAAEIASITNELRTRWGNRPADASAQVVESIAREADIALR